MAHTKRIMVPSCLTCPIQDWWKTKALRLYPMQRKRSPTSLPTLAPKIQLRHHCCMSKLWRFFEIDCLRMLACSFRLGGSLSPELLYSFLRTRIHGWARCSSRQVVEPVSCLELLEKGQEEQKNRRIVLAVAGDLMCESFVSLMPVLQHFLPSPHCWLLFLAGLVLLLIRILTRLNWPTAGDLSRLMRIVVLTGRRLLQHVYTLLDACSSAWCCTGMKLKESQQISPAYVQSNSKFFRIYDT